MAAPAAVILFKLRSHIETTARLIDRIPPERLDWRPELPADGAPVNHR